MLELASVRGRCLFPLAFVLVSLAAHAEAPAVPSMNLEEALRFARAHHPRLAVEQARVALAQERAKEPKAEWLPRFGATAQVVGSTNNNSATNWLGSKGAVEFPRIAGTGFLLSSDEINWKPYLNTVVGVTGEQRLFDFGRTAAEVAAADALTDAQKARLEDRELSVDLGVRESYYATLAARAIVEVAREAAHRSRAHRDDAAARVKQGVRPRVEEVRAEADLARFEVGVLRAESGLRAAQVAFAEAVGTHQPALDAVEVQGAPAPELPPLDAVLTQAEQHDPSIHEARLRARAAQERVSATQARRLPEVWAIATVSSAAGGAPKETSGKVTWGAGAVPWIPDYFLGAVFAWRFFDPILEARITTADRERAVSDAELSVVNEESVARVQQAWLRADLSIRALAGLERALEAARANYEQADVRFTSGLGTSVELADAEALRTAAEVELVLGRFELARARAGLARVVGAEL